MFVLIAFWIFISCFREGNTASAQLIPEDSLYTVALGAYKNGFLDLAIEQFKRFLDLYPNSEKAPFAWFRLGESYRVQRQNSQAEDAYKHILDVYPNHKLTPMVHFRLAGVKFQRGDFSSALSIYQRLLEVAPSSDFAPEVRFWIAESLYQLKRYPEALTEYRTYIKTFPGHQFVHQALYGSGWCLMEQNRYDEAIVQFKNLFEKNPSEKLLSQVHLSLGDALFEKKDYQGAIKHYAEFTKARPDEMRAVILKQGYALSQLGREEEVIILFQKFLKSASQDTPEVPDVLFRLGHTFQMKKRYQDAVTTFLTLQERYPDYGMIAEVFFQLGLGYLNMKQDTMARRYFGEMIQRYPAHERVSQASIYMGNLHYQAGQMKEAVDFYKKATKAKNTSLAAEAGYRMAELLYSMQKPEEAISAYQSVISSYPDQTLWIQMAKFRLGNIYEQEGKKEVAIDLYTQITHMNAGTGNIVQAAQERIQILKSQNVNEMDNRENNG